MADRMASVTVCSSSWASTDSWAWTSSSRRIAKVFMASYGAPLGGGRNVVIGTHSASASGVEISDLTIDANHDHLTTSGGVPLNLEGIILRSDQGGHWIHNVNVIGGSGDVGFKNVVVETFAVQIWGNVDP